MKISHINTPNDQLVRQRHRRAFVTNMKQQFGQHDIGKKTRHQRKAEGDFLSSAGDSHVAALLKFGDDFSPVTVMVSMSSLCCSVLVV